MQALGMAVATTTNNPSTGDGRGRHRAAGGEGNKGRASGLLFSLLFSLTASFAHEARSSETQSSPTNPSQGSDTSRGTASEASNTTHGQKLDFSIPQEQPLGAALRALVSQANTNVMFDESAVAGKIAAPLQMQGTLNQALKRLSRTPASNGAF